MKKAAKLTHVGTQEGLPVQWQWRVTIAPSNIAVTSTRKECFDFALREGVAKEDITVEQPNAGSAPKDDLELYLRMQAAHLTLEQLIYAINNPKSEVASTVRAFCFQIHKLQSGG